MTNSEAPRLVHVAVPGGKSPVSRAVGVPPGATTYYLSGQMPAVSDTEAAPDTIAAYGDTRRQTITTLERIETILISMGLTVDHLVHTRASLVADPATGKMDFEGFNAGYAEFFASRTSVHPARMVAEVAGLVNPGWLLEIEAIAAN